MNWITCHSSHPPSPGVKDLLLRNRDTGKYEAFEQAEPGAFESRYRARLQWIVMCALFDAWCVIERPDV